jgi:predicted O-methyltransferase YrrM
MSEKKVGFADKLLPDQQEHTYYYTGSDFERSLYETICRSSGIQSPHQEFALDYTDKFTVEEMASNPVSLRFLQFVVKLSGAKRVLEIGAFIGVSAMYFAKALPEDGDVVTIEKFEPFAEIARRNFEKNGLSKKIRLIEGDAFAAIAELPRDEKFDIVFIDGNKERYKQYMEMTMPLLAAKGMMMVDDVFFHGDVLNTPPTTEKGRGVKAALNYAEGLEDWLRIALPLANGILLMVRK